MQCEHDVVYNSVYSHLITSRYLVSKYLGFCSNYAFIYVWWLIINELNPVLELLSNL